MIKMIDTKIIEIEFFKIFCPLGKSNTYHLFSKSSPNRLIFCNWGFFDMGNLKLKEFFDIDRRKGSNRYRRQKSNTYCSKSSLFRMRSERGEEEVSVESARRGNFTLTSSFPLLPSERLALGLPVLWYYSI